MHGHHTHHTQQSPQHEHGQFRRHGGFEPGVGPRGPRGGGRGHRGPRGGRPGFGGGPGDASVPSTEGLAGWLAGRLPADWFTGAPEVAGARDDVTIGGTLAPVDHPARATDADRAEAEAGRITRFREDTRDERVAIAREIEHRYGRLVAWGATTGRTSEVFSNASVPVMTRLRQPDRVVLDTLVDAGVARSRSEALGWCVRLVGRNAEAWLAELREALTAVDKVRTQGPDA